MDSILSDEKGNPLHCETISTSGSPAEEVLYTEKDAKRVRRRLDLWILPVLMITYGLQYWDKALMGQAVLFNLAKDLELIVVTGHDSNGNPTSSNQRYANCVLMFYIGYLVSAYPMTLLTQRFPTGKVCGASIFVWAIITMTTASCRNYEELMVNRFFLGVAESCVAPAFTVYITFWWTRREQPFRSSLWYGMVGVALAITPLISWGLGHIHGAFGASTWKYMYLVAGAITLVWALIVVWVLPDDPFRARWLSERDRTIVLARLKENNDGIVNRHFKKDQVWEGLRDFNTWSNAFVILATSIPNAVFSSFSTPVIHGFGFNDFASLLLLMPLGAAAAIAVYGSGWITRRFEGLRYYAMIACSVPALAGALMCWRVPRSHPAALYVGLLLMPFTIGSNAVAVALVSSNVAGHTKKSTVSGLAFIGYSLGNIAGPLCFTSTPGPNYSGGFISCVVSIAAVIVVAVFGRWHLANENTRRDREYGPATNTKALKDISDRKNMDFRYVL